MIDSHDNNFFIEKICNDDNFTIEIRDIKCVFSDKNISRWIHTVLSRDDAKKLIDWLTEHLDSNEIKNNTFIDSHDDFIIEKNYEENIFIVKLKDSSNKEIEVSLSYNDTKELLDYLIEYLDKRIVREEDIYDYY